METIKNNPRDLHFTESEPQTAQNQARKLKDDLFAGHQTYTNPESKLSQKVLLQLEERVVGLQKHMESVESGLKSVVSQVNEFIKFYNTRFDKMATGLNNMATHIQNKTTDTHNSLTNLSAQVKERKVMDIKLEEMINRHNSVVRGYESRLLQLQKMISEKEAQYMSAQAALNDAKMEIARLKRL